ncbi:MAG: hypothetical protein WA724_09095 [Candidatus Dormiibacterota bacterium]
MADGYAHLALGIRPRQRTLSDPTYDALDPKPGCERLEPTLVKGLQTAVGAYLMGMAPA